MSEKPKDDTLFNLVFDMVESWDRFLIEAKDSQIRFSGAIALLKFEERFTRLKKYAGYLKK